MIVVINRISQAATLTHRHAHTHTPNSKCLLSPNEFGHIAVSNPYTVCEIDWFIYLLLAAIVVVLFLFWIGLCRVWTIVFSLSSCCTRSVSAALVLIILRCLCHVHAYTFTITGTSTYTQFDAFSPPIIILFGRCMMLSDDILLICHLLEWKFQILLVQVPSLLSLLSSSSFTFSPYSWLVCAVVIFHIFFSSFVNLIVVL